MKFERTTAGNATSLFVKDRRLTSQVGWKLAKVKKNIIVPCIGSVPFSPSKVIALPSGYFEVNTISITPKSNVMFCTDEGEQFPTPHETKSFIITLSSNDFHYFKVISDQKISFSKDFEILSEDIFEDMWSLSRYSHIAYARIPGTSPVPVIFDNSGILCISPF